MPYNGLVATEINKLILSFFKRWSSMCEGSLEKALLLDYRIKN